MAIDYSQWAHFKTPQEVYAAGGGNLGGWNWGDWENAAGITPGRFSGPTLWGGRDPFDIALSRPGNPAPVIAPPTASAPQAGSATQPGAPVVGRTPILTAPGTTTPSQAKPGMETPPGTKPGFTALPYVVPSGGTTWRPGTFPGFAAPGSAPFGGTSAAGNENRAWSAQGLDPRLDAAFSFAMQEAMRRYQDPNGLSFYGGPTVAGLTPDELEAQRLMRQAAAGASGTSGAATDFLSSILANAKNPGANPQVDAAVAATMRDVTNAATGPGGVFSQIRDNALGTGTYGGTRQGVLESLALGKLADSLGGTSARMRLDARGQDLSTGLSGISNASNFASMLGLPASMLSGVGAQNRAQEQAIMNDALTRWLYETTQGDTRLQNLFNSLNASPLGGWGSQQNWLSDAALNSGGGTSTAQNIAGGLATGGALWSILRNAGLI